MKHSVWLFGRAIPRLPAAAVTAAAVGRAAAAPRDRPDRGERPGGAAPPEGNGQAPPAPTGPEGTLLLSSWRTALRVRAPAPGPPLPPPAPSRRSSLRRSPSPRSRRRPPPRTADAGRGSSAAPPCSSAPPRPCLPSPPPAAGFFVKFNNADIYEVIHTLGRTAGINYLIDPRVRGVVNVHTQGVVRKDGALDLLFSILKVNGATAIKEGDTYHIVPMAEAKTEPLLPSVQGDGPSKGPANQVSMRAYPLQYIAVAEMAKVIKPFLTPGGEAVEVGRANILLVIDTTANLEKTARLVELFDSEVFRAAGMKLFKLKVLDPEEMAKNLENIFGALDFSARGGKPSGHQLRPDPAAVLPAGGQRVAQDDGGRGEVDR